jgi:hypothetical protein
MAWSLNVCIHFFMLSLHEDGEHSSQNARDIIHIHNMQYYIRFKHICLYIQLITVNMYVYWGDLGVDGWIILGWISRRCDVGIWTGLGWPRIETGGGRL